MATTAVPRLAAVLLLLVVSLTATPTSAHYSSGKADYELTAVAMEGNYEACPTPTTVCPGGGVASGELSFAHGSEWFCGDESSEHGDSWYLSGEFIGVIRIGAQDALVKIVLGGFDAALGPNGGLAAEITYAGLSLSYLGYATLSEVPMPWEIINVGVLDTPVTIDWYGENLLGGETSGSAWTIPERHGTIEYTKVSYDCAMD